MPTRGTKLTAFNLHAAWFYGKYNRLRDKRQKLGSGGVNYAAARLDPIVLPGFYWHSLRDLHLAKSKRRHGNAICCISETFNRLRTKGGGRHTVHSTRANVDRSEPYWAISEEIQMTAF